MSDPAVRLGDRERVLRHAETLVGEVIRGGEHRGLFTEERFDLLYSKRFGEDIRFDAWRRDAFEAAVKRHLPHRHCGDSMSALRIAMLPTVTSFRPKGLLALVQGRSPQNAHTTTILFQYETDLVLAVLAATSPA